MFPYPYCTGQKYGFLPRVRLVRATELADSFSGASLHRTIHLNCSLWRGIDYARMDLDTTVRDCCGHHNRQHGDAPHILLHSDGELLGTGLLELVRHRETKRNNPQHWSVRQSQNARPDVTKQAHIDGQAGGLRGVQPRISKRGGAACMGHRGIGCTTMGAQLLATGTGKAGRNPAAVPAHVDMVSTCKRGSAQQVLARGPRDALEETVDYAARGSQG